MQPSKACFGRESLCSWKNLTFSFSSNSNLFFIAQEKKWFIVWCVFRGKNLLWGKVFFFEITNKHAFYLVHFEENSIFEPSLFPKKFVEDSAENSFSMLWGELTNRWNVLAKSLWRLYSSLITKNFRGQRNFRVLFLENYGTNWRRKFWKNEIRWKLKETKIKWNKS